MRAAHVLRGSLCYYSQVIARLDQIDYRQIRPDQASDISATFMRIES